MERCNCEEKRIVLQNKIEELDKLKLQGLEHEKTSKLDNEITELCKELDSCDYCKI